MSDRFAVDVIVQYPWRCNVSARAAFNLMAWAFER